MAGRVRQEKRSGSLQVPVLARGAGNRAGDRRHALVPAGTGGIPGDFAGTQLGQRVFDGDGRLLFHHFHAACDRNSAAGRGDHHAGNLAVGIRQHPRSGFRRALRFLPCRSLSWAFRRRRLARGLSRYSADDDRTALASVQALRQTWHPVLAVRCRVYRHFQWRSAMNGFFDDLSGCCMQFGTGRITNPFYR